MGKFHSQTAGNQQTNLSVSVVILQELTQLDNKKKSIQLPIMWSEQPHTLTEK